MQAQSTKIEGSFVGTVKADQKYELNLK